MAAKLNFNKDPQRGVKGTKQIEETKISEPQQTFSLDQMKSDTVAEPTPPQSKMGRPRLNKDYTTIRIQRINVHRLNSLQNTLEKDTQDDMLSLALDKIENTLDSNQKTMFDMYMKTYEAKSKRKNS
ncbi:hypothetical protein [Latilactobacillus graminis]|uniref:hypothetical protein n=1 Tax=Latilactobacillus graminis TaxID=60519 RepID=UPI00070E9698|nr:hypothetical protein [Latilactobacillus graminis]